MPKMQKAKTGFFGNRNYRDDFLYQAEWIEYRDHELLNKFSLAWSRDGEKKSTYRTRSSRKLMSFEMVRTRRSHLCLW